MRGRMNEIYNITDAMILKAINQKLDKAPTTSKQKMLRHLDDRFGIMGREDFDEVWKRRNRAN